jgi:multiple antibiotic resistance protein
MGQHLQAIATLFFLVNPVVCAMMFAGSIRGADRAAMLRDATFAMLTVAAVLSVAAFAGAPILKVFGISLDAFSVAGGGVLIFIGLSMLGGKSSPSTPDASAKGAADNRLGALILFAASPGTITGVMTIVAAHHRGGVPVMALVAIAAVLGVTWVLLLGVAFVGAKASRPSLARDMVSRYMA